MKTREMFKPIHPFPARMASELVWEEMPDDSKSLRVLDPMVGSGTTLVAAQLRGHQAIGYDRDPLAVLISRAWVSVIDVSKTEKKACQILERAERRFSRLTKSSSYPESADDETREFIDFWFDAHNRKQLTALAASIAAVRDEDIRNILWCAFSRMIITKEAGVSLAMDVSHSRPHRRFKVAPHNAFEKFVSAVKYITKAAPFTTVEKATVHRAEVSDEDARTMPLPAESIDLIITSPPYLNAIDYLRGHKLSLVWMGHSVAAIRMLRATNMGAEVSMEASNMDSQANDIAEKMCSGDPLDARHAGMLRKYVHDLRALLSECYRVLRMAGKGVFVCGDCTLRQSFVSNSTAIKELAQQLGFRLLNARRRRLPENRRYLPPPQYSSAGAALRKRIRDEVIITLEKPESR
jgi:DNA modification methylase